MIADQTRTQTWERANNLLLFLTNAEIYFYLSSDWLAWQSKTSNDAGNILKTMHAHLFTNYEQKHSAILFFIQAQSIHINLLIGETWVS